MSSSSLPLTQQEGSFPTRTTASFLKFRLEMSATVESFLLQNSSGTTTDVKATTTPTAIKVAATPMQVDSVPVHEAADQTLASTFRTSSKKKSDDFLSKLNAMANQASDPSHNPIASASRTESAWHAERSSTAATASDVEALNIVLKSWKYCSQCLAENHVSFNASDLASLPVYTPYDAALHALELLEKNVAIVDTISYNIVMDAFFKSRHKEALRRVELLFKHLQQNQRTSCRPDLVSWNTLLDAVAYSDRPNRIEIIERIWKQMNSSESKLSTRIINTVLHAYGRSSSAMQVTGSTQSPSPAEVEGQRAELKRLAFRCEEIFESMTTPPDSMTYTNLMMVHARRGTIEGAERAEALFDELFHQSESSDRTNSRPQPLVYSYTVLISMWANIVDPQAPHRAEAWMDRLKSDPRVQPNTKSYNACMKAWARSNQPIRAVKVLQLLQEMKGNAKVQPDRLTYQTALDACRLKQATPQQQTGALKIAFAIFRAARQERSSSEIISPLMYATLLRVVAAVLSEADSDAERNDISTALFQNAIQEGLVNPSVIRALAESTSSEVLIRLLKPMIGQQGEVLYDKIPSSWTRNVR